MLQRTNAGPAADYAELNRSEQGGLDELIDFAFGFLRRQYLVILFFTLMAAGAGAYYLYVTPPKYTASARFIVGQRNPFIQQQSTIAESPLDSAELESRLQVLQSTSIASAVIDKLQLFDDPEFDGSNDGRSILGSIRGVFEVLLTLSGNGSTLDTKEATIDPKDAAMAAFASRLKVGRVGISRVIEINFSSRIPERAVQITNEIANVYIADQVEAKLQGNRAAATWLQERLQQLGEQGTAADRAVLEFKQQNNIIAADGKFMDEQQVADLNARLVASRAQTSELLARLNRIEAVIRLGASDSAFEATVSEGLLSPILTNLRQQYLELKRREADWSAKYGRNHLAVVTLRNRIRDIRVSTLEELRRIAESSKSDYEIAKQREAEIEKQLAGAVLQTQTTNKAQVTLHNLETSARSYRQLYETFLQRHMSSVQQDSLPISDSRLISPASTLTSTKKPKSALVLALAVMGGIGLGAGIALLRDLMDRGFRTGAQLEAALQMPCLALVPLLKETKPNQLSRKQAFDKAVGPRTIARDASVFWRVVDSPLSPFAESIRSIKMAINLNLTDMPNKVIGFTSSLPDEGKSTTAAALAQLMAQAGSRVILVDCDLRNPSLSRSLAPQAKIGLVDVISGVGSLREAVWRDPTTNLVLLPTLTKAPLFHACDLLAAESTKKLFDTLRANFDYVIVDLPPIAPVVDVRATTQLVDSMILVVEWGRKLNVVQHALNTAPNVHLMGAVLNKADMDHIGCYDRVYNYAHYARYGYSGGDQGSISRG